jgi:hypothetical protein
MRDLFKEWTREPFACLYVEYKGRSREWYSAEVPRMLDWMSRKKRHTPMKEMGRANLGGKLGEEFRSSRDSDARFYWLRAESIVPRCQGDHRVKTWGQNYVPATFQAHVSVGNEKDSKGNAKIWNQANIRVTGAKQVSFWIPLGMFEDLNRPLAIRVNGEQRGGMRNLQPSVETLLEEVYRTGDRQRLFIAKIDL